MNDMTKEELNEELKAERESLIEDISNWCDEIKDTIDDYGEEDINDVFDEKYTTLDFLESEYDTMLQHRFSTYKENVEQLISDYEDEQDEE